MDPRLKRIISVFLAAILLLVMPLSARAQEKGWEMKPLPPELSHYYQEQRGENWLSWVFCELGTPQGLFLIFKQMILHDIGVENTPTSNMARDYLMENAILPLKERKSITLQGGSVIKFEELDRLALAQLIYYFCRDHILFPHPEEYSGMGHILASLPFVGPLYMALPYIIKYPCEAVSTEHGECGDQAPALAALLKLEGYDVALGFFPSMGRRLNGFMPFFGYHHYVLLRDEGWGIGKWHPKEDMFGNPMPGDWIVLDPICSPRHAPYMKMVGEPHKALKFGEQDGWTKLVDLNFVNLSPCAFCADPFRWGVI
jgi:hypothetical protein